MSDALRETRLQMPVQRVTLRYDAPAQTLTLLTHRSHVCKSGLPGNYTADKSQHWDKLRDFYRESNGVVLEAAEARDEFEQAFLADNRPGPHSPRSCHACTSLDKHSQRSCAGDPLRKRALTVKAARH